MERYRTIGFILVFQNFICLVNTEKNGVLKQWQEYQIKHIHIKF